MYQHPFGQHYGNGPPAEPRRRTSTKPRKERPDVDKVVDGVITQLKTKGLFDHFRKDCLSDVDTKPSYINLQAKINGTIDNFLKGQLWSSTFPKLKMREAMRKKIEEAPYFAKGLDSIVEQALGSKVESIFKTVIEEEVFSFMGCEKQEYEEKERLKQERAEAKLQRPPSPPPEDDGADEQQRPFKMLRSDFYHMPPGYGNLNDQPICNITPPPPPPMEPPPPPPEEDEFDEPMDYTPVTPPYPPPPDNPDHQTDEPLPPGEETESTSQNSLDREGGFIVENGSCNGPAKPEDLCVIKSEKDSGDVAVVQNPSSVHQHMNGWSHDREDEDTNKELPSTPKNECLEEEDSEEESPMFEKIGEVSPPRPVLLENSDDILRELKEQARLNNSEMAKRELMKRISKGLAKHCLEMFDNNSEDSGSSNLVICEDYNTPPQEQSFKSDQNNKRINRNEHSENSNSSSAASTPHKHSHSSSSKDKRDASSKSLSQESKHSSHSSSSRPRSRSSRSSSSHRSRDRDRHSSNSKERDQDKDKAREKSDFSSSKSSQSSRSHHHHSSSSSSQKRSSSSHSSHKQTSSSSASHRHSSSSSHSHKHSSRRSSSSTKSNKDEYTSPYKPDKDGKSKSTSSKNLDSPNPNSNNSNKDMELFLDQVTIPGPSDTPDTLSPFKLPEQLRPFASIGVAKSVDRDQTIVVQPSETFSITMEDEVNGETQVPASDKTITDLPPTIFPTTTNSSRESQETESTNHKDEEFVNKNCISIIEPKNVSPIEYKNLDREKDLSSNEIGESDDSDETCRYLEPMPVFEEKLSYYRKLPEFVDLKMHSLVP